MSSFTPAIPEISPSVRWAQSANNTFLEVKFATRFDSPACLDIFDQEVSLQHPEGGNSSILHVSAMCRNDKKLLKYFMDLELSSLVQPFTIDPQLLVDYEEKNKAYDLDVIEAIQRWQIWRRKSFAYDDYLQKKKRKEEKESK